MSSLPNSPFRGAASAHDAYPSQQLESPADMSTLQQQPAFDRRASQSDSDISDSYTPNSHLDLLEPTAPYALGSSSRSQPDSVMANGGSALQHQSPYPSYQAPFAAGSTRDEDDSGAPGPVSEDPNSADFAQTFYDPFRIKHRRRTSPPQLKILEFHFDRNPKPDVTLRKNLSEQLDMTPREVQVWFQNRRAKTKKLREKLEKEVGTGETRSPDSSFAVPTQRAHNARTSPPHAFANLQHNVGGPDYNSMRRGSSPAVLSSGLTRFDGYYEPTAPPPPHSFAAHGGARPAAYHPPPSSMYPSPMSLSNSGLPSPAQSPNELIGDFHQISPAARAPAFDDPGQHGRRFSLPAYGAGHPHPAAGAQWFPTKEAEDHSRFAGTFGGPGHHPNPYPPLDYNQSHGDLDFGSSNGSGAGRSPDFGFGAPRDDGSIGGDYSPSSSGDEQHVLESAPGAYELPGMGQYTFGSATRWEPDPDHRAAPLDPTAAYPGSSLSPLDQTSPGGRRSSCPAGFVPHFDNLGLASPSQGPPPPLWNASYAPSSYNHQPSSLPLPPHPSMQKRHSFAAPYPGPGQQQYIPAPGAPLYAPLPINPAAPSSLFPQNPQFAQNSRRGSTSSALGTIVEQPSSLAQYAAVEDGQASPHSLAARKSRSQASLRATPPYPSPQDRAERRSPLLQERRVSIPSADYFPLP